MPKHLTTHTHTHTHAHTPITAVISLRKDALFQQNISLQMLCRQQVQLYHGYSKYKVLLLNREKHLHPSRFSKPGLASPLKKTLKVPHSRYNFLQQYCGWVFNMKNPSNHYIKAEHISVHCLQLSVSPFTVHLQECDHIR